MLGQPLYMVTPQVVGFRLVGTNLSASFLNVTGAEAGAERQLTGTQYMQLGERGNVPPKVGASATLRGG